MNIPFLIIGSGLSGLAAAIRFARFSPDVLILERHSRIGGLNSYFYRGGALIETGLHAITNFAAPTDKKAPLNRLLRQLKLNRSHLHFHEQMSSEIRFPDGDSLLFSNNFNFFCDQVVSKFPRSANGFSRLLTAIDAYDCFQVGAFKSAKEFLHQYLEDTRLVDMLLCPLMFYGSSTEDDMDLGQFVIMFRSIFQEGMFRPQGTIKDFLELLLNHYTHLGGQIRLQSPVARILHNNNSVSGVVLESGESIRCEKILSTIGAVETLKLLDPDASQPADTRLGFVESIFRLQPACRHMLPQDRTIIFYNDEKRFHYRRPQTRVDFSSGVICFPGNFNGLKPQAHVEVRATHLADYSRWKVISANRSAYLAEKQETLRRSAAAIEKIIGNFRDSILYEETFTPLTIERFTAKIEGAIYGSPRKFKNGTIGYNNLFLAGTDQGFLGIIGSMLSGVSMVNQHILPAL